LWAALAVTPVTFLLAPGRIFNNSVWSSARMRKSRSPREVATWLMWSLGLSWMRRLNYHSAPSNLGLQSWGYKGRWLMGLVP
jgi:hypothetical protein